MSEPDTTITMRQVLGRVPSPSRLLRGIRAHVVVLFLCGVLLAVVIPQSPRLPGCYRFVRLGFCFVCDRPSLGLTIVRST